MAFGQIAAHQPMPIIGALRQGEGYHGAIQHAQNTLQGPHPHHGRCAAPAHGFRPGEGADQRGQSFCYQGPRFQCAPRLGQHPKLPFLLQNIACCAVFFEKTINCLIRRTNARAAFFLGFRGDAGLQLRG